ncbi:MAG: MarR family winged helix-turn-helix transcriptional regulator [Solirubrobacterales bacterium]
MGEDGGSTQFPKALEGLTLFLVGKAGLAGLRHGEAALRPFELRPREFWTLAVIEELGDAPQQSIANRLAIDRSDMVAIIDKLQSLGMVTRARDPQDRRKQIIRLSVKGRRVFTRASKSLTAADNEFLTSLTKAQREQIRSSLARLAES